jgi:SAM-dependent methyltransferase
VFIRVNLWQYACDVMNFYSHETYGERVAGVYDDWFSDYDPSAIDMLAELAGGGKALELGIGTGRIALPLSDRGIEVHGIDAAPSMISRLRSKPGAERLTVTQGNFAEVLVQPEFALVYIVFNTLFALPSQEAQVQCFRNVAAHLSDDGCFLVEAFVPDLTRFTSNQVNWATKVTRTWLSWTWASTIRRRSAWLARKSSSRTGVYGCIRCKYVMSGPRN